MRSRTRWLLLVAATAAVGLGGDGPPKPNASPTSRREAQAGLKEFGALVGEWKGTGQPRRGQAKGAWTESASWAWKLDNDTAALVMKIEKGKYLRSATLRPGANPNTFQLEATLADGSTRMFRGQGESGKPLVLKADQVEDGLARITMTIPNESRFLLLLEAANASSNTATTLTRLGEVGFTRQGSAFAAVAGASGPECIVTGGRGTIKVTHAGKDYWVCCSGCRDLFNTNPAAVLAEAADKAKKPAGK